MNNNLTVEWRPIESVQPYKGNPRTIPASAVEKVAKSLEAFGWRQPIVVDEAGIIVVGHTRFLAAKWLRMPNIPVHVMTGVTPEALQAYRIADNRTHEEAQWDLKALGVEFGLLQASGFDLALTAFNPDQWPGAAPPPGPDPEETPAPPAKPTVKAGEIWILGNHRVICGDSTDKAVVERLLAGARPNVMVTDPPYGVNYDANWRNNAFRANGKKVGARAIGKVSNDHRDDWREAWALFPGDICYVWHGALHAASVQQSLEAVGFEMRTQIMWNKSVMVISRGNYHYRHEPCWHAVRKGKNGRWLGGRKQTSVWDIEHRKSDTGHSTQKPLECMRRPIDNHTKPAESVYDPFLGSGTTLIAAEMEKRVCFGCELNPAYVEVIILRWQATSGKIATREDGKTLAQLQKRPKKKTRGGAAVSSLGS